MSDTSRYGWRLQEFMDNAPSIDVQTLTPEDILFGILTGQNFQRMPRALVAMFLDAIDALASEAGQSVMGYAPRL